MDSQLRLAPGAAGGARAARRPLFGPPLRALYGVTLGPGKGLLLYSPPTVLALLGLRGLLRRAPALGWAALATVALTLAVVAPLATWSGEYTWGPRYLLGAAPLLLLGLPAWLAAALSPRGLSLRNRRSPCQRHWRPIAISLTENDLVAGRQWLHRNSRVDRRHSCSQGQPADLFK